MKKQSFLLAITASALGFFVDLYDIIIVSIVRKSSLLSLGVPEDELLSKGVLLLNVQMGGMLIGGFIWELSEIKKAGFPFCSVQLFSIQSQPGWLHYLLIIGFFCCLDLWQALV